MLMPWDDPKVSSLQRSPDHSVWGAYENAIQAANRTNSRYHMTLNGIYSFALFSTPKNAGSFYALNFNSDSFKPIQVPGNWETQGFGKPIYTNVPYPWPLTGTDQCSVFANAKKDAVYHPPLPPAKNPTGCYRKWFNVPEFFFKRDIFLRFEGVETAFMVWVNGKMAGYSEDSKLPVEFEVTGLLKPGKNLLAVQVMRFATSSWLEDQDYWHLSGIHRNVSLIAKPMLRLQDWQIIATPDLFGKPSLLEATVTVSQSVNFADCRVRLSLMDALGKRVGQSEAPVSIKSPYTLHEGVMTGQAKISFSVPHTVLWYPERPYLYTAIITLLDPNGEEIDFESSRVGFKSVSVSNGIVYLNGARLVIRGVNRHEHEPRGRTVSPTRMREEIRHMKRIHINAVRTCHYPSSPIWYDLCDELGLLVLCECNLETHGVNGLLSNDPAWAGAYLERAVRMACQYKNHACIYAWSLGNESGFGAHHAAMYGWLKEYDKTRLCQYECGAPGVNISDVRGNMYAPYDQIQKMLTDPNDIRPIILVEYLYQISNSGGGIERFRELTETYKRFQGGFIWDWQDKALEAHTPDGVPYYGYGGDFGEPLTDSTPFMCCNGIVLPDLTWKPVAYAIQSYYAPVWIERRDGIDTWHTDLVFNRYTLLNRFNLADALESVECTAILKESGIEIARMPLALPPTPPGEEREFTFTFPFDQKPDHEYHLDMEIKRRVPLWYDVDGDLLWAGQFSLPTKYTIPRVVKKRNNTLKIKESTCQLMVDTNSFSAVFDTEHGLLDAFIQADRTLLSSGKPCFDRPYTGLDCQAGWGWFSQTAPLAQAQYKLLSHRMTSSDDEAVLTFEYGILTALPLRISVAYHVSGTGMEVCYRAIAKGGWLALPRAGLCFLVDKELESITYFGYGPMENYPDRLAPARLGVYNSTVTAQHFPFIPPAETGGHEGTRWLSLQDNNGTGIHVTSLVPFHFDVRHSDTADYRIARHDHQLIRHQESFLHLDATHSPIGGDMGWSTNTNRRAMLGDGVYTNRYSITAIK